MFEGLGDTPAPANLGRGLPTGGAAGHDGGMTTSPADAVRPVCTAVAAALAPTGTTAADLSAPTPCADLDLRGLVEHFVGTSGAMGRLGLGEPLDPADPWGGGEGAAEGDWEARLRDNLDTVARGWSRPEAWRGDAEIGGSTMPRSALGEMALVEVAVHGWDLARALGRTVELPPEAAAAVHEAAAGSAGLGRQMGAYGPAVPVPDDASALDRTLGDVGRPPPWTARPGAGVSARGPRPTSALAGGQLEGRPGRAPDVLRRHPGRQGLVHRPTAEVGQVLLGGPHPVVARAQVPLQARPQLGLLHPSPHRRRPDASTDDPP